MNTKNVRLFESSAVRQYGGSAVRGCPLPAASCQLVFHRRCLLPARFMGCSLPAAGC